MKTKRSARSIKNDPDYTSFFRQLPKNATYALRHLEQKDKEMIDIEKSGSEDKGTYVPASYATK